MRRQTTRKERDYRYRRPSLRLDASAVLDALRQANRLTHPITPVLGHVARATGASCALSSPRGSQVDVKLLLQTLYRSVVEAITNERHELLLPRLAERQAIRDQAALQRFET